MLLLTLACSDCQRPWFQTPSSRSGRSPELCPSCKKKHRLETQKRYNASKKGLAATERYLARPGKRDIRNQAVARWTASNPDRVKENATIWREANRDKVRAQERERRTSNPERTAKAKRKANLKRYGLTEAGFQMLLESQDARCAICGTDEPGGHAKQWHVDHDHSCCNSKAGGACAGCRRGLLCSSCNVALGLFKDSPEILRSAAGYIEHHREKGNEHG